MREIPLILEDTRKIVEGLEIYLKGLYEIGEREFTIQIVQGHLGQFLTARTYLEKGYKVWWTHPDYDLQVDEIGKIEVKTARAHTCARACVPVPARACGQSLILGKKQV